MSDETRNEKSKVLGLAEYFDNLDSSEGPKGRCYRDTDRDNIREQYNNSHVPMKTARVEEIPLIKPLRMHRKSSSPDVGLGYGPEDEVIEELSTSSSDGDLEEFDEAAFPNNCSPHTLLTEDEIEERSDAQSEFETSSLICEEAEDGKNEELEHTSPQETTARNDFQDELRKVKEEKNTKIELLDNIILRETTTRNGSQDELRKVKEDLESKEEQIVELQNMVEELSFKHEITQHQISQIRHLQSKLDSSIAENEALRKDMHRLRETVAEQDAIIRRTMKERDERIRERDECISALEKERDEARREKEAMAEQVRQAELAHLRELHEQRCRQMREAHEHMQAQKSQALRDERESQVPDSRSESYRQGLRGGGLDDDSDGFARREFIDEYRKEQLRQEQERSARLQEELRRSEEQRMHLGVMQQACVLYQQSQLTHQRQLTRGFDDENFASSMPSSSRTHRRARSGEGGKTMKMSRPKRDRTKMSATLAFLVT